MRALLLIAEGFGVGTLPHSEGDGFEASGTETLQRLLRDTPDLELPTLFSLGLGEILKGRVFDPATRKYSGCYGRLRPTSPGVDPISLHWELAGVATVPAFLPPCPPGYLEALQAETGLAFLTGYEATPEGLAAALADPAAPRQPILLAGPQSHLWVAASETLLPFARLHEICRTARRLGAPQQLGAVRAVPLHDTPEGLRPAPGGHTYGTPPPQTLLNRLSEAGLPVESVGESGAHFAYSGITQAHPAATNAEVLQTIDQLWHQPHDGMVIATLPDFTGFGSEPALFAVAAERLDHWLAGFVEQMDADDLLLFIGGHGIGPAGLTREEVPALLRYDGRSGPLGLRQGLGAVATTLAAFFEVEWQGPEPLATFHRAH